MNWSVSRLGAGGCYVPCHVNDTENGMNTRRSPFVVDAKILRKLYLEEDYKMV